MSSLPEHVEDVFLLSLALWLLLPIVLFVGRARRGAGGVLAASYVLGLFTTHWLGAFVHASPWSPFVDSADTVAGFQLATGALLALLLGIGLVRPQRASPQTVHGVVVPAPVQPRLRQMAGLCVVVGGGLWIVGFTPVGTLPSLSAVTSAGRQCLVFGVCLFALDAWGRQQRMRFGAWLLVAAVLPLVTVLSQGFIGYGIAMLGSIVMFVAMFYRPRWHLLAGLGVGIYLGMSFWVAYAMQRTALREAVWGGQDIATRLAVFGDMAAALRPFDMRDEAHLALVDVRLNQNHLVGVALRTTPSLTEFAYGGTLVDAVLALIPRALWPEKPVVAGSGNRVALHTLTTFADGTSVGMGQVLEFYINFGVPAVLCGFVLLGLALGTLDRMLVGALAEGNGEKAVIVFVSGAGILQPGGALAEIVASMAGGAVVGMLVAWLARDRVVQHPVQRIA